MKLRNKSGVAAGTPGVTALNVSDRPDADNEPWVSAMWMSVGAPLPSPLL
jgi:hypothetical protein